MIRILPVILPSLNQPDLEKPYTHYSFYSPNSRKVSNVFIVYGIPFGTPWQLGVLQGPWTMTPSPLLATHRVPLVLL